MAKRRKEKRTYKYECNLTGEQFTLTEKAANSEDLMSVEGYYQMNPDDEDRPEDVRKKLGIKAEIAAQAAEAKEEEVTE